MRTQWTTKGNRDAGSSCSRDWGLHQYLRNFGGGGGLNPPNHSPRYATACSHSTPPLNTTVPLFMILTKSKQWDYHAQFQGLTTVLIKIPVFWNMMLCSIVIEAERSSGMLLLIQHYSTTSKKTAIYNAVITITQNFLRYTVQNS